MVTACGAPAASSTPAANSSPLTAHELARDPAVSATYPGSVTMDGKPAGTLAESVRPETLPYVDPHPTPCSFKCQSTPGYHAGQNGQAMRHLAAPGTRQQILNWYVNRLLRIGWRFELSVSAVRLDQGVDTIEMLRPQATMSVTTYSTPSLEDTFMAGGARLTVYSLWLTACRQCKLPQPSDLTSPPTAIDLSADCPLPHPPAQVTLSGAASGSTNYVCGNVRPSERTNFSCDVVRARWPHVHLVLVIDGRRVFWAPGGLRILGPYTSDERDWTLGGINPYQEGPLISGDSVHVHEELHHTFSKADPAAVVDVTAPCTSFIF
jgi:hypothetical protein